MRQGALSPMWRAKYWPSIRVHVHLLIAWGYEDARVKIGSPWNEPDITGFIVEAIQARLESVHAPRWCRQYAVKEDHPEPGEGRTGRRRRRPDIVIECTKARRPKYVFEAKPLKRGKYAETHYLGNDALQRFITGPYAARYPEGAMLGYVQSPTVEKWAARLRVAIDSDATGANVLRLTAPQHSVSIIPEFPHEWISIHDRSSGLPITVHHILLEWHL